MEQDDSSKGFTSKEVTEEKSENFNSDMKKDNDTSEQDDGIATIKVF
jgi:hypothetical protein